MEKEVTEIKLRKEKKGSKYGEKRTEKKTDKWSLSNSKHMVANLLTLNPKRKILRLSVLPLIDVCSVGHKVTRNCLTFSST